MKPNILAIAGPTATGKTELFLKLIKDGYNFEAIVADSRQIYRFMDIGTGKDLPVEPEMKKKFWLVDTIDPDEKFSSANFYKLAQQAMIQIRKSGHQPVIVGGTGRYLKDLESSPETLVVPPNIDLRAQLEAYSITQLQNKLSKSDSKRLAVMNNSDRHNPRRLIRAIEVSLSKVRPIPNKKNKHNIICLSAPLQLIKVRITQRVEHRMKHGMINEVQSLLKKYPNFSTLQSSMTPGYQEIISYLNQETSLDLAVSKWTQREIAYAKRQLTWFRHQTEAVWFDISQGNWYAEIVKQLEKWGYGRSHSQN